MQLRHVVSALWLAALACSSDGNAPVGPPPPPPPPAPPPGPTVVTVTHAPGPSQLVVQNNAVYWYDSSNAPFKKLSLTSGASPVVLMTKTPAPDAEISDGAYAYWVSSGRLYRTTLDGAVTIELDSADIHSATEMALDSGYVYWVAAGHPTGCSPGCRWSIRRVPRAGGAASEVALTADGVVDFMGLAVGGGYVFWEEGGVGPAAPDGSVGSKIIKQPLTGGAPTTIVDGMENGLIVPPGPGYTPASWHPRGGIIADSDQVYFADADFVQSYRVMSVPVSGGPITILLADTTGDANDFVRGMTSDATTLYWADLNKVRALPKTGGSVTDLNGPRAIPLEGITRVGTDLYFLQCCFASSQGGMGSIFTIPTSGGVPVLVDDSLVQSFSLAADAANVFWLEGGPVGALQGFGSLRASALSGANIRTLVEEANGGPFAVDANAIYFADVGTIKRVPIGGGKAQRLAIGGIRVVDIATDGQRVYWLADEPNASVGSVSVNGGAVTALGAGPGPAARLRIDGTYVYWLGHRDEIDRVPKAGGTPIKLLGPIAGLATDFAIDATYVYISGWDSGQILRAPLAGGATTPIHTLGADQTRRIEADGGKVYWIDQLKVGSVTADGQTQVAIDNDAFSDPFTHNGLAFDSHSVFWTAMLLDEIRKATPK